VREDMHAASICHHGVVIWPTLLALSERTPLSGATLDQIGANIHLAGDTFRTNDLVRKFFVAMCSRPETAGLALRQVAHRPQEISAGDAARLRERIEERGLLFKVRVLGYQVREKQKERMPAGAVS